MLLCILYIFICKEYTFSQNYTGIGSGFSANVRSLVYDSTSNYLYAGGQFDFLGPFGNPIQPMHRISRWNGIQWDSLGSGVNSSGSWINDMIMYNGNLLIGGNFTNVGGVPVIGLAQWDGSTWQSFANASNGGYGGVNCFYIEGNDLYVGGSFDSINGVPSDGIVRFNGSTWYTYPPLGANSLVAAIIKYNNELYLGGNFQVGPGKADIVKFDGINWVSVGGGFSGAMTWVNEFTIFQNELIVGGYFSLSTGDPGNYITKWDGSNWGQLGSGLLNSNVWSLLVFQNELYAAGCISLADGLPVSYIAKWDGMTWSALPNAPIFNNCIGSLTSNNSTIFFGGGFQTLNGDTVNRIAQYNLSSGESENPYECFSYIVNDDKLNVITNDCDQIYQYAIYDITGRIISNNDVNEKFELEIDISFLKSGVYFFTIYTKSHVQKTFKVVIQ